MRLPCPPTLLLVLPCLASLSSCNCSAGGNDDAGVTAVSPAQVEAAIVDVNGNIYLLQTDGGAALLVDRTVVNSYWPVSLRWNPQGTRLAYADGRLAYLREADGTVRVQGRNQGGRYREGGTSRVEWSPDGTRLAIDGTDDASDAYSVFLVAPDGGEPEFLSWVDRWAWEPSGLGLLFTGYDSTAGASVTYRYDLATGDAGLFLEAELLDSSPRGPLVLQRSQPAADGGSEVVVLVRWPDGGTSAVLPPGSATVSSRPTAASCSPYADEAVLEVTSAATGNLEVWRASFSGGPRRLFESGGAVPSCLRFLPGGEYLSYVSGTRLVLVAQDGGPTQLDTGLLDGSEGLGCLDWRLRP